jgi:light-regulated signal transduction histidine kinase (bacteriophytochrome)
VTVPELAPDDHHSLQQALELTEEALQRSAEELERRNGELQSFASLAAHDLRQPLQVVGGFAALLSEFYAGQLDGRANGYLAAIGRGVETMTAMVDSLLEFARAGEAGPPECLTDSARVVQEVVDGMGEMVDGARVIVRGCLPVLPANPAQLTRVFQNLIGNGLKFRREQPVRIEVGAARAGDDWVFDVADNGMGIDPAFAPRTFGMFQREQRGPQPGSGMGLAICERIVENHGGRIWFASIPGVGSTFSFSLPAETPPVP